MGGLSINGRSSRLQLLLRRRHQQGHRLEQRQLRRAGARLDRGSPRPDLELPGRVRPQLRRDDHRHHPQRLEGLPRQRRLLQARRRAERQRVQRRQQCGLGVGAVRRRRSTSSTTPRGRSAARCSFPAPRSTRQRNKLFFFLSQDILARTDPGDAEPAPDADRARARAAISRRPFDSQGRLIFIRDPQLAGRLQRHRRRPGVFPEQRHPGQPDRPDGTGAAQPVPAAERDRPDRRQPVQLRLPDGAGLAAQRPGAAHGLERRADTTLYGRLQFGYEKRAGGGRRCSDSTGGWPQHAEQVRDRHRSATSTRCCTRSTRRRSPKSRSA